jgi:branched-chain amino acid transport system permease protein
MRVYYVAATTLSAFLSGIAGALYAFHYTTISPSVMGLTPLSLLVLMILVGGMGTVSGPIVGTFVVMVLTEFLCDTGQWRLLVLGIVLLAILVLQPTGLVRLFGRLMEGLTRWMNEPERSISGRPTDSHRERIAWK